MAVPATPDKQVYDVPAGSKDQEIIIQTRRPEGRGDA